MNSLEQAARLALKPKDRRPPWQYIEEHFGIQNSPFGDRPNFGRTPWLKKPSEKFADNRIRSIILQCCVQGSKTFFMQTHAGWALCEQPGPLGYYVQTNELVTKVAQGRWLPMVRRSPLVNKLLPGDRFALGKAEIYFTDGFSYIMAANTSNTQTLSLRYVFCDDTFIWTPGMLKAALERATRWWNRKTVIGSAGGDKDSDTAGEWSKSCQDEWAMLCPDCKRRQIPDIEKHIRWPTNELTKPKGQWNYDAVKAAARFRCEHCSTELPNTPETVRLMNDGADYVMMNPNAPADSYGARWNSICLDPSELSWGDLAIEWIKAARAWKAGHILPMKDFRTKRMGQTFDEKTVNPFASLPVVEILSAPPREKSPYPKLFWPLQDWLIMAIDVQADHFWVLVMAWSKSGDECALDFRKTYTWSDCEEIQTHYGVMNEDVCVDCSHRTHEVIRECARRAKAVGKFFQPWWAYRGDDAEKFIYQKRHPINNTVEKIALPYAWPPEKRDPTIGLHKDSPLLKELKGRKVPILTWSNPSIKDIVTARRDGKVNVKVETARGDWNDEYHRQIHSERKELDTPKFGRRKWRYRNFTDNHGWDCRCMCTTRAIRRGLIADVATAGENA